MEALSAVSDVERRREQKRRAAARYRERHPEKWKAVTAAYRERNRAKKNERNRIASAALRESRPEQFLLYSAKRRAKQGGYAFSITIDDIIVPRVCPILGLTLQVGKGRGNTPNAPTLDKIDPKLGYVPGNVQVISRRANTMKSDASKSELVAFAKWVMESVA